MSEGNVRATLGLSLAGKWVGLPPTDCRFESERFNLALTAEAFTFLLPKFNDVDAWGEECCLDGRIC